MTDASPDASPAINWPTKAEWLAALRSGEFEQGSAYLKHGKQHCCLGVLCVLAKVPQSGLNVYFFDFGKVQSASRIPTASLPDWLPKHTSSRAMSLNDEYVPFAQIADWLETQ